MEPIILAPTDRLSRHYAQRVKQILSRFNDIRELIQHEGMKGTRVEQEVRKFLIDFLPERYQYSSGIVIDNLGEECDCSRQEDILIVDKFFNPKLFLDEEPSIYPVEVVYCGIEVKTSLDASKLKEAVDKIISLKSLNFVRESITYTQGNRLTFSQTTGPFGMIFAFDSPIRGAETLLNHFATAIGDVPSTAWPDLVCILNRGILGIGEGQRPVFQLFGLLGQDSTGRVGELLLNRPSAKFIVQGQQYPVILMDGKYYVVDVARTFTAFLNYLYDRLLSKVIMASSNLLTHYIPEEMSRFVGIACQDTGTNSEQIMKEATS